MRTIMKFIVTKSVCDSESGAEYADMTVVHTFDTRVEAEAFATSMRELVEQLRKLSWDYASLLRTWHSKPQIWLVHPPCPIRNGALRSHLTDIERAEHNAWLDKVAAAEKSQQNGAHEWVISQSPFSTLEPIMLQFFGNSGDVKHALDVTFRVTELDPPSTLTLDDMLYMLRDNYA